MGGQQSQQVNYVYEMPNSKEPGFTPVYRNSKFYKELTPSPDPSIRTFRDVVLQSCLQKFPNNNLAGKIIVTKQAQQGQPAQRQIRSLTYRQCFDKAELLGKAILGLKLQFREKTQNMGFIGIYAKNRVQWLLTDLGCTLYGLTSVPLYDTLGLENLSYCLNQTEMTTLFVTEDTLKVLLDLKDHGKLKNVVLFDRIDKATVSKANKLGFTVIDFQTLIQEGKKFPNINYQDIKIEPENIHTFSYTSGTTGPPKGAMLSHRNFTAFLFAFKNHDIGFEQTDVYLSFLPLPHVFERVVAAAHILVGSHIVFYAGDMLKLKDDCQLVKPTIFIGVPRIYNKIVDKVRDQFHQKTGIAKCLVDSAVSSKSQSVQKDGNFHSGLYDSLVFNKVKEAFGGKIKKMVSGSAPLSKQNFLFMQMIMSAPMFEGYGQTQNTAAAFIRSEADKTLGNVGGIVVNFYPIQANLQFRLADIPEMKYTSNDRDENGRPTPRGQVWLRGPAIFAGYYKQKEKTDEAITRDGWLKTGDVAVMLEGGRMRIVDRKKNIFKLQQGEYIAPEKVEDIYKNSPYVEQVFLHGESTHNCCVTVVKPAKEHFMQFAKQNNLNGSYEELCQNKQMRILLLKHLNEIGKKSGLNSLEVAKNIYLESLPFADKGILTNTMKLQRFEAKTVYKQVIENMYAEGELPLK